MQIPIFSSKGERFPRSGTAFPLFLILLKEDLFFYPFPLTNQKKNYEISLAIIRNPDSV
jgi:hypothetical protein